MAKIESKTRRAKLLLAYKRVAEKTPAGEGSRFAALVAVLQAKGCRDPKAVAAAIGRKKYGAKKMSQFSAKGNRGKG